MMCDHPTCFFGHAGSLTRLSLISPELHDCPTHFNGKAKYGSLKEALNISCIETEAQSLRAPSTQVPFSGAITVQQAGERTGVSVAGAEDAKSGMYSSRVRCGARPHSASTVVRM